MSNTMTVTEILDAMYDQVAADWADEFVGEVLAWAEGIRDGWADGDEDDAV